MATNFQQHMGGQMTPQQQQQQQQRQQQLRAQNNNVQQMIMNALNNHQTQHLTGWQTEVLVSERMGLVFSVIGNLRLASQTQPNPPDLHKMTDIAIRFERDIFEKSADKMAYKRAAEAKLEQLLTRRNENQAGLQQSIQAQAQAQAQAQHAQAQQMMMNQNMQGQMNRNMPPQSQPFQHLQHQMQASPIPGQIPPQLPMGMQTDGMPPNMTPNPQQQFHLQMQQQHSQQGQNNMPARPQNPQPSGFTPQETELINDTVNRLMAQASEETKNSIRANIQSKIDPVQLQRYQANGVDLATLYYRNQVVNKFRADRQRAAQQAQLGIPPGHGVPMQPQRSMGPSPLNGQQGPQMSMGVNTDTAFMENIAAQQQRDAVMAQANGELVVPASNLSVNAASQPNSMPNQRTQQQQQFVNAQQAQQQARLQQAAALQQQQQQSQARLNAQVKAQQLGLQGQPNGMGSGPMPPQPSPAMPNLNTPLRTPTQQMGHPGPDAQIPAPSQFGQPLDPRFMQGNQNQRPMGPGTNNLNAMAAGMPLEQRQQIATLSPGKLNEMVSKWTESQRAQQMNAQHSQGIRPGMPMQAGRPGQQVPPSQFNPQMLAIQQFMRTNPGRPVPPSMSAGMSPQQQIILHQQIQRMQAQNQNPMQRNAPLTPNEQRIITQMDSLDFPQAVHTHQQMPRGIPTEIKKWGQLKQWVAQNPSLGQAAQAYMENIRILQKMHYQNILRSKQQAAGGMVQGPRGGQPGMPGAPPNMSAPVAPMGQNPMQMQMGMAGQGIRPPTQAPTQEEINTLKSHPGMANMSEDQIRHFIQSRNAQMTPMQQQQRQQQLLQMQQLRMNQASGPLGTNPAGTPQMAGQPPQPKPAPAPADQSSQTGNRPAPRPQQNTRNAAPTSSPAQPARNLKRASSDDVVEVPNPNLQQQQQRSVPQQHQATGQQAQQGRYTPQQLAALDPESRKKYETMMRMRQQPPLNQADLQMLRSINEEESKRAAEPGIQMDPETKNLTIVKLRSIVPSLTNVTKAIPKWYQITHNEARLRAFFHAKHRLQAQFTDNEMKVLKDVLSIRPVEIDQAQAILKSIVKDLSDKFPSMVKPETTQQQAAPTTQAAAPAPNPQQAPNGSAQSMPLNAANLQQQQQQLSKLHQRSNSRSSHHPPAAPTSAQPPFQFGAPSPHGTPAYIGKNTITQDNLHIPARKKQKQSGNAASGQTTPGPIASPEVKREQVKPQSKPVLVCLEPECDRHNLGFETQEALNAHTQEEHIRPLQDPSKYAQENLASLLGLDNQGLAVKPPPAQEPISTPGPKQGQTANGKAENTPSAETPMNRQASMTQQSSVTGAKSKVALAKDAQQGPQDAKNVTHPNQMNQDPWANATIDPHDLFQAFQPFETGAGGAISDVNVYRSISPNDTPESSNHVSEPNSDISDGVALDINLDIFDDSWQPFGPSGGAEFDMGDLGDINEDSLKMFDDDQPNYTTWDDAVGQSNFDNPFAFDTSLYSLDVE